MTPVRLEPAALRSRGKHSTTEPLVICNHIPQTWGSAGDSRANEPFTLILSHSVGVIRLFIFVTTSPRLGVGRGIAGQMSRLL